MITILGLCVKTKVAFLINWEKLNENNMEEGAAKQKLILRQ